MVKDAELNAEADKKRRETVEAKNQAESLIDSTEKSLGEHGDKIEDEDKSAIEDAIAELKEEIGKEDLDGDAVTEKTEALAQASMKLGQAIYEATQAEQSAEAEADAAADAAADDVVDADFEDISDDDDEDAKKSA